METIIGQRAKLYPSDVVVIILKIYYGMRFADVKLPNGRTKKVRYNLLSII